MTSRHAKPILLIVDDVPENIDILSEMFIHDYTVKAAINGEKALKIAATKPYPDLILLDIMMPGMDGYEVCRHLKNNEQTKKIPVIFVTAVFEPADEVKGLEIGATDYIVKPFSPIITKARIKTQLELKFAKDHLEEMIKTRTKELAEAYENLQNTQQQIIQQEKLASIGQLAAGIAHEVNNPIGFITSNLGSLKKYVDKLTAHIGSLCEILEASGASKQVKELRKRDKLDFILEDLQDLINESLEGTERVQEIVRNLKSFSRVEEKIFSMTNLNECLEEALKIAWNELKYKATIIREFGELPQILCFPQQLKQVFINLLVNAAQAIDKQGAITVRTSLAGEIIKVSITDTGCGIAKEHLQKIFEPFFTTKKIGKGTGLGMSISLDIVKKHNGQITVESEIGKGTIFTVELPVTQPTEPNA